MKTNDEQILQLFFNRDERALTEIAARYGRYCHTIAYRVLADAQDAEECVNDTWLRAWNAIPPERPVSLSAYVGTVVRNLSINRAKHRAAKKRMGERYALCIDELAEVLPDNASPVEEQAERAALEEAINAFLDRTDARKRNVFVRRYFYMDSIEEIAARYQMSVSNVKVTLHRLRAELKRELSAQGYSV